MVSHQRGLPRQYCQGSEAEYSLYRSIRIWRELMLDQPCDDPDLHTVCELELCLLTPEKRQDTAFLRRVLHPDFIEFGASGRTWTRKSIIADLTSVSSETSIEATAMTARRIDTGTVFITYRTDCAGRRSLRSSIWVQHQGRWTILFHQGTPARLECDLCGFEYETVSQHTIGPRVIRSADAIAALITERPELGSLRPSAERWSVNEYGAHVRDVFLLIRDRLVIGLVEDNPGFKPGYKDERLALGLYAADTAVALANELPAAAAMLIRLFDAIDPTQLMRPVQYGYPDPSEQTLLWMGRQAVHESEHHYLDIVENLRLLSTSGPVAATSS